MEAGVRNGKSQILIGGKAAMLLGMKENRIRENRVRKHRGLLGAALAIVVLLAVQNVNVVTAYADTAGVSSVAGLHTDLGNQEWWNFRNSAENNGVISAQTPSDDTQAGLLWAKQLGNAVSPLILDGYVYTASGNTIYKLDKKTGGTVCSATLAGSISYNTTSMTYAEGMIFVQIGNGQIQALDATTLESAWVSKAVGGQTLCPITYHDGYIYSGTWNGEQKDGTYFCLSVKDEDPDQTNEEKDPVWSVSHSGGFYWAGSYASDSYVVFGSDDGSAAGDYTDTAVLYSVSPSTGNIIDTLSDVKGDIRSSVVYQNGYVYFTSKAGYLYRVEMKEDGTFGTEVSYDLGGSVTATPVVNDGRIYIGVGGTGGQYNADSGHSFVVLNDGTDAITKAYSVSAPGYPQAAALLSDYYSNSVDYGSSTAGTGEEDAATDGNGTSDTADQDVASDESGATNVGSDDTAATNEGSTDTGADKKHAVVYFTCNASPGSVYYIDDTPGQTEGTCKVLYMPGTNMQNYCLSTICAGTDGTLYYRNDSGYLMAIENITLENKGDDGSGGTSADPSDSGGAGTKDSESKGSSASGTVKEEKSSTERTAQKSTVSAFRQSMYTPASASVPSAETLSQKKTSGTGTPWWKSILGVIAAAGSITSGIWFYSSQKMQQ